MGLDVKVFKNVEKTNNHEDYDFIAFVIDPEWEYKIINLEAGERYTGVKSNTSIGYPYSTHNRFREDLLRMQGKHYLLTSEGRVDWEKLEKEPETPFYELINFADNEGCLDWDISKKLFKEFQEWEDRSGSMNFSPYFESNYKGWLEIFREGKDPGSVVVFM